MDRLKEDNEESDFRHSYGWQNTERETAEKIIFSQE